MFDDLWIAPEIGLKDSLVTKSQRKQDRRRLNSILVFFWRFITMQSAEMTKLALVRCTRRLCCDGLLWVTNFVGLD